ncbi:hypothetical protein HMPREF2791_00015 [Corynebacterium sp. HMSC034A01]|nr:hypothetical protein HMPREF2791_00015 [Corynebacterium sp. HMSC034A01]
MLKVNIRVCVHLKDAPLLPFGISRNVLGDNIDPQHLGRSKMLRYSLTDLSKPRMYLIGTVVRIST